MEFKKYKLKEVGEIVGGATPLTSDSSNYDGDIPWITPNDLSNHKSPYISQGERNITKKGLKEIGNRLYPSGTVLFSSRAPIGYVSIAKNELCTNQGFKSIIPNLNFTTPEYLYYLLGYYKHYIEKKGAGTTFKEVSGSVMENIELPFPSLDNQVKIANCLMNIDKKISLNTRMNAELEAMAKQLYDYWFVQFDFPDENGKPYKSSGGKMVWNEKLKREIPEGWEVGQVGDFANIFTGKKDVSKAVPGKYLFFSCAPEPISSNEYIYDGEAVLVSGNGSYTGRVTYYKGKFDLYQRTYACILKDYCKELYPWFYCYMKYYFQPIYSGGKHGSAIPYIVLSDLTDSIVVFNGNVMAAFSHTMSSILNTFYNNHYRINGSLTHLRDSLLPMLMNGQVTIE